MTDKNILAASMQKRAGISKLLTGVPLVGGGLHGLIDPVEGSPRGTSLFYEGLGGLGGSLAGGLGGALAFKDEQDRPGAGGLLGGGVLGGALGSALGRWLAESKEDPEIEELRKLIGKLRTDGGTGIVVNVGQAQSGPTAAAAINNLTDDEEDLLEEIVQEEDEEI